MKLTIVFLLFFTIQVGATGFAQQVTIIKRHAPLSEVFKSIESQTGYLFFYDKSLAQNADPINISLRNVNLEDALIACLKDRHLTYTIVKNTIVIRPEKLHSVSKADKVPEDKAEPPVEIYGMVTNQKGEPIQNASVLIAGTKLGTTTGADGRFKLNIPDRKVSLEISSIGYQTVIIKVGQQSEISVTLEQVSAGLGDVIVVGYGTQKKADVTGSVTRVGEKDLQSRPVNNFQDALVGRASGVQVSQTGGDLDGRFSIKIRGAGSVTSSIQPLIVVDGVPLFTGGLSSINPADIVSVDILKDASATAIYGARASNGVVIVTTRRGQAGETKMTFSVDAGYEQISKMYKVLTSEQQRALFFEAFKNANRNNTAYSNPDDSIWSVNNNWQKLATRSAFRQTYNLSITGGGPKNSFAVSAGYFKREGTVKNSDITDYYLRANNDMKVGKKLKIASSFTGNYEIQHTLPNDLFNSGGVFEDLVSNHTFNPAYDAKGNLTATNTTADPFFGANGNPLINILLPTRSQKITRLLGSVKADYEIVKGLVLSGNLGSDIYIENDYNYRPLYSIGIFQNAQGSTTNSLFQGLNWVADATLEYQKVIGLHSIKGLVGVSAQQYNTISTSTTGVGTVDNSLNQLSNQTTFSASGSDVSSGLLSSFARVNYDYDNRYLLTGTVRRDGSSRFGPGNQYGIFPSGSAAWRISQEKFFNLSFINDLKIRASYGITGNQNIPNFAFITRAGATPVVFGNNVSVGNSASNIGNSNLQWESAKQMDAGIDVSFLGGRINFTADYYDKRSENLLIQVPLPNTSGVAEDPTVNLGSVSNSGVEFFVSSKNISGKFNWTTDFNISYNKNKVLNIGTNSIGDPLQIPGTVLSLPSDYANLTVAGRPIGAFYMYQFIGIWQTADQADAAIAGAVPGDPRYADLNKNGKFDIGDKTFVGNSQPTYYGGFNNNFSYGNFSLAVFMNFAGGNKLYNAIRNLNARAVPYNQQLAEVADFWTPTNPSNKIPRPSQGGNTTYLATKVSTRFLEDASFIKLKNVSLSYNIPARSLERMKVQAARISLTGTNLVTWTKYSGLDPESASVGGLTSGGLDLTPYPPSRLYSLSLSMTF